MDKTFRTLFEAQAFCISHGKAYLLTSDYSTTINKLYNHEVLLDSTYVVRDYNGKYGCGYTIEFGILKSRCGLTVMQLFFV